jgi:MFS transporter, putative metabolite:H+ symporter
VLILALVVAALAAPSIAATALIAAIPLLLAVLAFAVFGIETRGRRLEDISVLPGRLAVTAGEPVPPRGAGN